MGWLTLSASSYFAGLRYTLILNVMGVGFLLRALQGDVYVLNYTTRVPRWFLIVVGLILQVPGVFYVAVGFWSVSQITPTPTGR